MAHHVEPMDVDCIESDFDNKENTFHHSNVRPCTEKGYEELDVSELNMKLRYSMTPASSPMSKSYTACLDNKNLETDDLLNCNQENTNLTRSLNSTMTKNDSIIKSLKSLPLQSLPTEPYVDGNCNPSVLRNKDSTLTDNANLTIVVSERIENDENLSLPSTSSSALHTPEATTPTKEIAKDGSSPIMRGLKSVLNMFRSSQSPIPPVEGEITVKQELLSPVDVIRSENSNPQAVASTPISAHRNKDGNSSKRSSPYKDSIVFNEDLEKELNWKDETTIIFSHEKIPIHKLYYPQLKANLISKPTETAAQNSIVEDNFNSTVEYMDVSYKERSITEFQPDDVKHDINVTVESDGEFVDCETTFTKNESPLSYKDIVANDISLSAEKQNLDTTKDIVKTTETPLVILSELDNTCLVLPGEDVDNHVTNPSDFSDYSKETTEILSELEKLEENVSSKLDSSDKNLVQDEKGELQKSITEQHPVPQEIPLKEQEQEHDIKMQENQLKKVEKLLEDNTIAEKNTTSVTLCDEPKLSDNEAVIESTLETETFTVSGEEMTQPQYNDVIQINTTQKNFNDIHDVALEALQNMQPAKTLDNKTNIQDVNKIEIENVETFISEITGDVQIYNAVDNNIATESLSAMCEQKPADVPLPDDECQNGSLDIVPADTTNVFETGTTVPIADKPSDLPLPEEDDADQKHDEFQDVLPAAITAISVPESLENVDTTIPKHNEDVKMFNAIPDNIVPISETILEQKPADVPLPDDESEKVSLEMVPSDISNVIEVTTHVPESEKPDIPLPKKDNTGQKLTIDEIQTAIPTEITPTPIPESLGIGNDLPELNSTKNLQDIIVEDKYQNHTSTILSGCTYTEININKRLDEKLLEESSESTIIKNVIALPEHSNTPIEVCDMSIDSEELTAQFISDETENVDKKPLDTAVSEKEAINYMNATFDQTYSQFSNDITQIVDESQYVTNSTATVLNDNIGQETQNQIEDNMMDISNNVNLNQTHNLPDIVNQTIVKTEQNVENPIETVEMQKVTIDELTPNFENSSSKLDATIDINQVKVESESDCSRDSKNIIPEPALPNTTSDHQYDVNVSQKDLVINSTSINERESGEVLENVEVNNDDSKTDNNQLSETVTNTPNVEHMEVDITTADEELILSENNSPYVSLVADADVVLEKVEETFETIDNPFEPKSNLASSPPITSKGYNFNFDEMDDPFATKTKIRLSPPLETPVKSMVLDKENTKLFQTSKKGIANRRKSQPPEKKKPVAMKKKLNATIDSSSPAIQSSNITITEKITHKPISNTTINLEDPGFKQNTDTTTEIAEPPEAVITSKYQNEKDNKKVQSDTFEEKRLNINDAIKSSIESIPVVSSEVTTTSSSEQSTYFSAGGTSSTESFKSKNVFNLPEIDDVNFNPFATKSKMRQSPPPDSKIDNPFATRSKMMSSPDTSISVPSQLDPNSTIIIRNTTPAQKVNVYDKTETELMEKETSIEMTNTTSSSGATDNQNITTLEVHTEDEDTIEGPFLEAEDDMEKTNFHTDDGDLMQMNDFPTQRVENNMDEGELFIDAEAFEFLLNQNKSNVVADSGKESLFLKFDPLFAKRISSDAVLAAMSKVQKKQSTPTKPTRPSLKNDASPIAGPSTLNITYDGEDNNISQESNDDVNITISKPMMVVTPAVNPAVTPRNKSITPTRSNRRSITFTSPAIAVIDRLLSMSGNSPRMGQDSPMTQADRDHSEADLALTQLRELLAEKEISVYNLRSESKELKDRLAAMETQVKILETDGQDKLKKINELTERLAEKTTINKSMAAVVEEYERTIASLIAETEQDKKRNAEERIRLINERDEQTAHLASMEVSFSDLHSKYEKSKQVIFACKANEESYKKSLKEFEENLSKMHTNYEMLKQHATSKLNHANQELEKINRAHEAEVVKLSAMIKRKDLHITSLEETLAQKTKANEELTAICDELINKVG